MVASESRSVRRRRRRRIRNQLRWRRRSLEFKRGTVNGMLPDFRFVLGAGLAIALIAVAGLGLVTSVQLAHEARIGPLDDSHRLAYAGHFEWNQFYDPEAARRFQGLAGKSEAPVAETRLATPAETAAFAPVIVPPADPEERTASIPPNRHDPDMTSIANDPVPQADTPPTGLSSETPAVTIAALPAESAGAEASSVPAPSVTAPSAPAPSAPAPSAPAPEMPGVTGSATPPAERVANAPATLPEPERPEGTQLPTPTAAPTLPQTSGDAQPDPAPPTPRSRPKFQFHKKIVRRHIHHLARQQTVQNSGLSPSSTPWPGYDNQFGAAARKSSGLFPGTLANRPQ
jgi:hypothetical protein